MNVNDGEVKDRISKLEKREQDDFALFQKFHEWNRDNTEDK